ncbi:MAG: DUF4174 domain-containing protein [Desulfobacterales bacterium]|nr:MAG: DUF4174 domain-containing protein [Desulfobacterales bacterium]
MDLNQFKWKNRLLFIFAPQNSDPFFSALQNEISTQRGEVLDRDLVVFKIFETGPSFKNTTQIGHTTAEVIRKQFDVPPGRFTVILVGKDGGVKLTRNAMVKLKDIFALIDSMPMRQEEMRRKAK